jgi:hypothetical protein
MSESQVLIQFKNNLVSFIDELIAAFPQEPDLIILRIFLKDQVPILDIMNKLIHILNKDNQQLKKDIEQRNESVFLKNENIFEAIAKSKSVNFQKLWRSDCLDDDERKIIWKWIDSFVLLSERYVKAKSLNT